jgi:hypothetical protein
MKRYLPHAAYAAFAILLFFNFGEQPVEIKWFILSVISAGLISFYCVMPSYGFVASVAFSFFVINSTRVFLWKQGYYSNLDPWDRLAMFWFSADAFAKAAVVIAPFVVIRWRRESLYDIGSKLAAIYCLLNALEYVLKGIFDSTHCLQDNICSGVLMNPSISSSIMVVCLPFLLREVSRIFKSPYIGHASFFLVLAASLISRSSIAIGEIMVCFVGYQIMNHGFVRMLKIAPIAIGGTLLVAWTVLGQELFNTSDRVKMWTYFANNWLRTDVLREFKSVHNSPITAVDHWHYIIGTGAGTFGNFTANLTVNHSNIGTNWWCWAHNDWLTVLFENGLFGLSIVVALYLMSLWKTYKEQEDDLFVGLLILGACSFLNPPLHVSVGAVLACWLLATALLQYDLET